MNDVSRAAVQSELPSAKEFPEGFEVYKILVKVSILVLTFYYKYTKLLITNYE